MKWIVPAFVVLGFLSASAFGQPTQQGITVLLAPQPTLDGRKLLRVRVISTSSDSAIVQVLDANGVSRGGLGAADFEVRSEGLGSARIIRLDSITTSAGLALTFVLDNSSSMFHAYDSLTHYLDLFVGGLASGHGRGPRVQYSAIVFDNAPRTSRHLTTAMRDVYIAPLGFTDSVRDVARFWHFYDTIRSDFTPLYDAIAESLDPSEDLNASLDSASQQVIIVVSDGADNASRISLEDLAGTMRHRPLRLFAINFRSEPDRRLIWLARHTDGTYFYADNLSELRDTLKSLRKSLFHCYVIHYRFPPKGAATSK